MKFLYTALCCMLLCFSCIPVSIAPRIETNKLVVAKKFKRKLPKRQAFVFNDPKDENEFYNYVNTKYERHHNDVECNTPFEIDGAKFYFSFHEVEKKDKTINFLPFVIDTMLDENNIDPILEKHYTSRKYHWYIVVTVDDAAMNDCLNPDHENYSVVIDYLEHMRKEYLETSNYLELLLKKKSIATRP